MTSLAGWLFVLTTYFWEWFVQTMPGVARFDDDWLMLTIPSGMTIGHVLWMRTRRNRWIHIFGPLSLAVFVGLLVGELTTEVPPGMENLGRGIGRMIAVAFAFTTALIALASLAIATVTIAAVRLVNQAKLWNKPTSAQHCEK